MTSIFAPIIDTQLARLQLTTARDLACLLHARIVASCVEVRELGAIAGDRLGANAVAETSLVNPEAYQAAEELLADFQADTASPSIVWRSDGHDSILNIGWAGRCYDITVLPQPTGPSYQQIFHAISLSLQESGRPVLVACGRQPDLRIEHAAVCWNGTLEASRAVAHSLPLLPLAKAVTIVVVPQETNTGPSAEALAETLSGHATSVNVTQVDRGSHGVADAIIDVCSSLEADLIVRGAFTRGAFLQRIIGGPTRDLLERSQIPLFLAS